MGHSSSSGGGGEVSQGSHKTSWAVGRWSDRGRRDAR